MSNYLSRFINKPTPEQLEKVDTDDWYRAGGKCICSVCHKFYDQHKVVEFTEYFHLNELCNGDLVKL